MEQVLRQPFTVEQLPVLARLNRWAFRSGRRNTPALARFFARAAFYGLRSVSRRPALGRFSVQIDSRRRSAQFDARNRMFAALYFDVFAAGFEPHVTSVIDRFTPDDGVFYDIGSNWGWHAIYLATRPGFHGKIHAFEPWPPSYRDLCSVVEQLELGDVITCHNFAVGERRQTARMQCKGHSGYAKLASEGGGPDVQVRALDELDIEPPSVIKIDTEGHEEQVFRGAEKLLAEHQPMLVFEHRYDQIVSQSEGRRSLDLLAGYGYKLFLPSWRSSDKDRQGQGKHPGLNLISCPAAWRYRFPEHPDLMACHGDKLWALENTSWQPQNQSKAA